MRRHLPESDKLEWWSNHVRKAFANLGRVLGPVQLNPAILERVSHDGLPGHEIIFGHKSSREQGRRKGIYTLVIKGPAFAGEWHLPLGQLEKLARAAAKTD
jgi:hypothetical protein